MTRKRRRFPGVLKNESQEDWSPTFSISTAALISRISNCTSSSSMSPLALNAVSRGSLRDRTCRSYTVAGRIGSLVVGEDLVCFCLTTILDEPPGRLGHEPRPKAENDRPKALDQVWDTPRPGGRARVVDHGEGEPGGEDGSDLAAAASARRLVRAQSYESEERRMECLRRRMRSDTHKVRHVEETTRPMTDARVGQLGHQGASTDLYGSVS